MPKHLQIAVGQSSSKGHKLLNQDFCGVYNPEEPQLSAKGIAIALADGISSSDVSHIASETAVSAFLEDYFCTSDAWSVKKSARRILIATNSWLHAQTQNSGYRYDKDRGYVCTLSALIIKSTTAHIFHVGDARIYRLHGSTLEQLTDDHRVWVSQDKSYLSRALGVDDQIEIDYQGLPLEIGDIFLLMTDGVYEYVRPDSMLDAIARHENDLDQAAKAIVDEAFATGSADNLTVQILRIENIPDQNAKEIYQQLNDLPFPPALQARMSFDGYDIIRALHISSRSHVYLAMDPDTDTAVVIKTPASDLKQDPVLLERFLTEEWIARRINNPHVAKPCTQDRKHHYLYVVMEYIDGQTLTQWMIDNPKPELAAVRGLVEQIAEGLRAFHRQEMVHQDLRPDNILIDNSGTAKIIDFGSAKVAGLSETTEFIDQHSGVVNEQYSAPEYFVGEDASARADIFSLGVITYQMLTGRLPYGTQVPKSRTRAARNKLKYTSVLEYNSNHPAWLDGVLKKAVHPNWLNRYAEVSEFVFDLRHPRKEFLNADRPPILQRNPATFWKGVALILTAVIAALLVVIERS